MDAVTLYATLSHRKVRGWGHLRKVEQHNARTIDTPSRDNLRPMPIELIAGDGDMVARTEALLTAKGVSHTLRKNAVLAYEDVYGASPGYWARRYPGGWESQSDATLAADPVVVAALDRAKEKYGDKLVSVRLHLDEKTPHVHVVSVPLVTRMHRKRGRKRKDGTEDAPVEKTTLYASCKEEGEGGRGGGNRRLEIEHDEWAAVVAHLGLVRGKRGSELTEAERRDRRLRDVQATRQGEERARQRREIEGFSAAVNRMSDALTAREASTVAALEDAERIRSDARRDAADARLVRLEVDVTLAAAAEDQEAIRRERASAIAATTMAERQRRDAEAERATLIEQARAEVSRMRQRAEADIRTQIADLISAEAAMATAAAEHRREAAQLASERSVLVVERRHAASERAFAAEMLRTGEEMKSLAEQRLRDADAKREAADLFRRQLSLLGRAVTDDDLNLREDGGRIVMNEAAMNEAEKQASASGWSALARQVAASFAAVRAMAAKLRDQLRRVALAEEAVARREKELREREGELDRVTALAGEFERSWSAVPEGQRNPAVATAIRGASALMRQAAELRERDTALPKRNPDDDASGVDHKSRDRGPDR